MRPQITSFLRINNIFLITINKHVFTHSNFDQNFAQIELLTLLHSQFHLYVKCNMDYN